MGIRLKIGVVFHFISSSDDDDYGNVVTNKYSARESGQVYCEKQSLPINRSELKLFLRGGATDQTTPRRSFSVQSQGISFFRSVT